jgi:hypothetical protein
MIRDYRVYGRLVLVEPRVVEHLPKMTRSEEDFHEDRIQGILNNPTEFAVRYVRMFVRYWKLYPEQLAMASPEYREQLHEKDSRVVKDTILTTNNLLNAVSILSTGPLFLFAVIGTIAMWFQREQRRELSLLWATILSFALVYSMFWVKIRYRFPSEPYIIILSAYGITKTWVMISTRLKHGVLSHKGPFALPKQS